MADYVEEIKARLGIYDVVSSYVQLKKAGHNYKGLCPFHSEKTSSFVVSPEKQICHCFGCNKGGDIFTFIQEIEGVSFSEALNMLAERSGVEIKSESSSWKKGQKSEKDEFFKAQELACDFFEHELYHSNDGAKVLEYLHRRGLNDETITKFRIGFSPDKYDALYPSLLKKGVSRDVLIKSGLVATRNIGDDNIYDKYRSRLIFPIFDALGRIAGFGGRALKKDQMPKYLNSPESIIYNKSRILYGFNFSKAEIKKCGVAVFVEGYFDVVLPFQEGVCNVVATSGTALTSDQAKLIKRIAPKAVTCFDSDVAGFEATKRANVVLTEHDVFVGCVSLDEKDPADYVLAHGGNDLKKKFEESVPFFTYLLDKLVLEFDIATFEGRKKLLNSLLPLFKPMSTSDKDFYVGKLAMKMGIDKSIIYDDINSFKLPESHPSRVVLTQEQGQFKPGVQEQILAIILAFPSSFESFKKVLSENDFDDSAKSIYKELLDQYNSSRVSVDRWVFDEDVAPDLKKKLDVLVLYAEDRYQQLGEKGILDEVMGLKLNLKLERIKRERSDVQRQIDVAAGENDKDRMNELMKRVIELRIEEQNLKI